MLLPAFGHPPYAQFYASGNSEIGKSIPLACGRNIYDLLQGYVKFTSSRKEFFHRALECFIPPPDHAEPPLDTILKAPRWLPKNNPFKFEPCPQQHSVEEVWHGPMRKWNVLFSKLTSFLPP